MVNLFTLHLYDLTSHLWCVQVTYLKYARNPCYTESLMVFLLGFQPTMALKKVKSRTKRATPYNNFKEKLLFSNRNLATIPFFCEGKTLIKLSTMSSVTYHFLLLSRCRLLPDRHLPVSPHFPIASSLAARVPSTAPLAGGGDFPLLRPPPPPPSSYERLRVDKKTPARELGSARFPNEPSPSQHFSSLAKRAKLELAHELRRAQW